MAEERSRLGRRIGSSREAKVNAQGQRTRRDLNAIEGDVREDLDQHIADTAAHEATPAAFPNRIMMRDGTGRSRVATPAVGADAANKAYVDGEVGEVADQLQEHTEDKDNPHEVTKEQVGLGDVDNVQQATKTDFDSHVADTSNPHQVTAAQAGADPVGSAAAVQSNLSAHEADQENPHNVTAEQVGADTEGSASAVQDDLDAHKADTDNPHQVTAVQAGADPAGSAATVQTDLDGHKADQENPHNVTAAQVGAEGDGAVEAHRQNEVHVEPQPPASHGNEAHSVDFATESSLNSHANGADAHKGQKRSIEVDTGDLQLVGDEDSPGSDKVYGTDGSGNRGWKDDPAGGGVDVHGNEAHDPNFATQSDFSSHANATNNPHSVTAAQVGAPTTTEFDNHANATNNPHNVTASQVGAAESPHGNEAHSPNFATQSALNNHTGNTSNPHNVTAAQAGADPSGSAAAVQSNLDAHTGDTNNPHNVTASQAGAAPVSHTHSGSDINTGFIPRDRGRIASSSSTGLPQYNGHSRSGGRFYGGSTNPNSTSSSNRMNYNGPFRATQLFEGGTRVANQTTLNNHINSTGSFDSGPHGSTSALVLESIPFRDVSGSFRVSSPSHSAHPVTRGWFETEMSNLSIGISQMDTALGSSSVSGSTMFQVHQYAFGSPNNSGSREWWHQAHGPSGTQNAINIGFRSIQASAVSWTYVNDSGEPRVWAIVAGNGEILELWEAEDPVDEEFPDSPPYSKDSVLPGQALVRVQPPGESILAEVLSLVERADLPSWIDESIYKDATTPSGLHRAMLLRSLAKRRLEAPGDIRETLSLPSEDRKHWYSQLFLREASRVLYEHKGQTLIPLYKAILRVDRGSGELALK